MPNDEQLMVEELYKKYGSLILKYLKKNNGFSQENAEDILQETFIKVFLNIEKISKAKKQQAYIFAIARNTALARLEYIRALVTNNEKIEDIEKSIETAKKMDKQLCLQYCFQQVFNQYIHGNNEYIYPLVVTLDKCKYSINKIATIIYRTCNETKEILKSGKKEIEKYQDLNEYQQEHGLKSLCWLIIFLRTEGWRSKEIAKILNKTDDATRQTVTHCRHLMQPHMEICKNDC